jgi:serine/threonine-protein phosphatase 2A activator
MPLPTLKIHTDHDVDTWRDTNGYRDYALFLRRLNEAVVGNHIPLPPSRSPGNEVSRLSIVSIFT